MDKVTPSAYHQLNQLTTVSESIPKCGDAPTSGHRRPAPRPAPRPALPRRSHGVRPAFPGVGVTGSRRQESSPGQPHPTGETTVKLQPVDQSSLPITRGWSTDRLPVSVVGPVPIEIH